MLPAAVSPEETAGALRAALRDAYGADARLEDWTAQPLTKRGKQRAVRYDIRARVASGAHDRRLQWVGKYYDRDDEAAMVATVLRSLAATDCGARGGVVIPGLVAYHAPLRLLVVTYEPGESVIAAIAQHDGLVLRAIGRALAALHATPVPLDTMTSPAAVLDQLRSKIAQLRALLPGETESLPQLLLKLEREASAWPAAHAFLHGDCGPAQLLWQDGSIVVLDFDRCTRGDPALDLGNLLTQLRRLALRKPGKLPDFAAVRADILDAYRRWSQRDPSLEQRVAWYEQATLVRKLHSLALDTTGYPEAEALQRRAEAVQLLECVP